MPNRVEDNINTHPIGLLSGTTHLNHLIRDPTKEFTNSLVSAKHYVHVLEKAMTPHSSALAWKIPWTEEPGRLQSMGSLGVGHD